MVLGEPRPDRRMRRVVGLDNTLAWKTGNNSLHAVVGWTLLNLHGHAEVTLLAVSAAGGAPTIHTIPLDW